MILRLAFKTLQQMEKEITKDIEEDEVNFTFGGTENTYHEQL